MFSFAERICLGPTVFVLVALVAPVVAQPAETRVGADKAPERVVLQLKWQHQDRKSVV